MPGWIPRPRRYEPNLFSFENFYNPHCFHDIAVIRDHDRAIIGIHPRIIQKMHGKIYVRSLFFGLHNLCEFSSVAGISERHEYGVSSEACANWRFDIVAEVDL